MKGYVYFAKFITFVKTAKNTCVRVILDSNLFTERNLKTWDFLNTRRQICYHLSIANIECKQSRYLLISS